MIYALIGEERFLVRRALEKLLAERIPAAARDFNLEVLDGEVVEARNLMGRAGTLPVLNLRRAILVRDADKIKKGELDCLEPLLSKIPETTDLIFVAGKPDYRITFWKTMRKLAKVEEFGSLYEDKIPDWIVRQASAAGYRISPEGARWLAASVGTDLSTIDMTLQKLYLFKGNDREISLQDVEASVTSISWRSVFDLADAVGRRDLPRALQLFRKMFAAKESPVALLGQLAWHFRTLGRVKEGETGGVAPFFLKKYQAQAGSFQKEELNQKRERLFTTDWALKSSPIPPEMIFEGLLMELCR